MGKKELLEAKLVDGLKPERLALVNESYMHSVPRGSETHWNLIIVSAAFEGAPLLRRHRAVHAALGPETMQSIHALTMKTLTPEEWNAAGGEVANPAPPCHGHAKDRIV